MAVDETIGALGGTFRYPFQYGYSCVGVVEESRSPLAVGQTVFAFHPHQSHFVADAADARRPRWDRGARGDAVPARRDGVADHVGRGTVVRRTRRRVRPRDGRRAHRAPPVPGGGTSPRCRPPRLARRRAARPGAGDRRAGRPPGGADGPRPPGGGAVDRRGVGEPRRAADRAGPPRPRGDRARRLVVRDEGRAAPVGPALPPAPPDDPQLAGVDDPGPPRRPVGRRSTPPRRRRSAR